MPTSCGPAVASLLAFPASMHCRQKPDTHVSFASWVVRGNLRPPIMRGTSACPQETHAIFLDVEPVLGWAWDARFRLGAPWDSAFEPVRLGAALRFVEPLSPCAGLIDFMEYGTAAFDAELMYGSENTT